MDLGTYKSVDSEIWFGDRFEGDTKSYVAIFKILIFLDSSVGQSPKLCPNGKNLNFDLLYREKSKFHILRHNIFVSSINLSLSQI